MLILVTASKTGIVISTIVVLGQEMVLGCLLWRLSEVIGRRRQLLEVLYLAQKVPTVSPFLIIF